MSNTTLDPVALQYMIALQLGPAALADILDPDYHRMPHLDVASTAIAHAHETRDHWVMIHTPPQVGKTLTAVEWTAFWLLCVNPQHEILIVSYNDDYAVMRGESVKRLVKEHGAAFGLHVRYGSASKKDWRLTSGGGLYSTGISGGITGRTGTAILIDDYIKNREEADSARIRAKLLRALGTEVLSRRAPGSLVIMPGTLWHEREPAMTLIDRYGRYEDGGKWRVLRMPAFCDTPDTDPLGRRLGEPLTRVDTVAGRELTPDEARHWWREQERGQNARDWSALFMARPTSDVGALMTHDQIQAATRPAPEPNELTRHVISIDPADADSLEATGHDENGIVHVAATREGTPWVIGDHTMRGSVDDYVKHVIDLCIEHDIDEIVYEKNKGGNAIASVIRAGWSAAVREGRADTTPPRIAAVTATRNKITRASPVAQMLINGEAYLSASADPPLTAIADQLATYQAGSSDSPDNMDAMVWGVSHVYRPAAHPHRPGPNLAEMRIRPPRR